MLQIAGIDARGFLYTQIQEFLVSEQYYAAASDFFTEYGVSVEDEQKFCDDIDREAFSLLKFLYPEHTQ